MITVITVGGNSVNQVSTFAPTSYGSLSIGSDPTQVSGGPSSAANIGQGLYIASGTGFLPGLYNVVGISGSAAVLNRPAGVPGSTGGAGSLAQYPQPRSVEFSMDDAVAAVTSEFTGQVQTQQWPGADMWRGTVTFPPMLKANADLLIAFLMECRGMANAFQVGDPLKALPRGTGGTGTVTAAAAAGSQSISLSFAAGALLVGDYIQVGYRLYKLLEPSNGGAVGIWPSVREPLTSGETAISEGTLGLFRLASNQRKWSSDYTGLTSISFQIQEYR
ncbi:MAG: hypothetical protein WA708_04475 [Acidobacteriaceae bacterium]